MSELLSSAAGFAQGSPEPGRHGVSPLSETAPGDSGGALLRHITALTDGEAANFRSLLDQAAHAVRTQNFASPAKLQSIDRAVSYMGWKYMGGTGDPMPACIVEHQTTDGLSFKIRYEDVAAVTTLARAVRPALQPAFDRIMNRPAAVRANLETDLQASNAGRFLCSFLESPLPSERPPLLYEVTARRQELLMRTANAYGVAWHDIEQASVNRVASDYAARALRASHVFRREEYQLDMQAVPSTEVSEYQTPFDRLKDFTNAALRALEAKEPSLNKKQCILQLVGNVTGNPYNTLENRWLYQVLSEVTSGKVPSGTLEDEIQYSMGQSISTAIGQLFQGYANGNGVSSDLVRELSSLPTFVTLLRRAPLQRNRSEIPNVEALYPYTDAVLSGRDEIEASRRTQVGAVLYDNREHHERQAVPQRLIMSVDRHAAVPTAFDRDIDAAPALRIRLGCIVADDYIDTKMPYIPGYALTRQTQDAAGLICDFVRAEHDPYRSCPLPLQAENITKEGIAERLRRIYRLSALAMALEQEEDPTVNDMVRVFSDNAVYFVPPTRINSAMEVLDGRPYVQCDGMAQLISELYPARVVSGLTLSKDATITAFGHAQNLVFDGKTPYIIDAAPSSDLFSAPPQPNTGPSLSESLAPARIKIVTQHLDPFCVEPELTGEPLQPQDVIAFAAERLIAVRNNFEQTIRVHLNVEQGPLMASPEKLYDHILHLPLPAGDPLRKVLGHVLQAAPRGNPDAISAWQAPMSLLKERIAAIEQSQQHIAGIQKLPLAQRAAYAAVYTDGALRALSHILADVHWQYNTIVSARLTPTDSLEPAAASPPKSHNNR